MPPAIAPPPRKRLTRHTVTSCRRVCAAAVVLGLTLLWAGARAEARSPLENTTVALLASPGGLAAPEPRPTPAPGPHASGAPTSHDGSHIPTPFDNPWALGLLAALTAWVLWMDRSQSGTKPESPEPSDRL